MMTYDSGCLGNYIVCHCSYANVFSLQSAVQKIGMDTECTPCPKISDTPHFKHI